MASCAQTADTVAIDMNDLPHEMLCQVTIHLSLDDLLDLRLVNRAFLLAVRATTTSSDWLIKKENGSWKLQNNWMYQYVFGKESSTESSGKRGHEC